jgi:hypothetical protein
MFTKEKGSKVVGMRPVPPLMQGMILITTVFVLLLGVFPQLGLGIVSPAASYLSQRFFPG